MVHSNDQYAAKVSTKVYQPLTENLKIKPTPIPRLTRILVPGKNRVTQKSRYWDCTNVLTNAKFPH